MPAARPNRKQLGAQGERLAALHLERLGWRIVERNFRCRQGEIDLIAEEPAETGATLVFIEVKTRHGLAHGAPSEAVDARKQQKLLAVALAYLGSRQSGGEEPACRFDVVEVRVDEAGLSQIELRRAVFTEK